MHPHTQPNATKPHSSLVWPPTKSQQNPKLLLECWYQLSPEAIPANDQTQLLQATCLLRTIWSCYNEAPPKADSPTNDQGANIQSHIISVGYYRYCIHSIHPFEDGMQLKIVIWYPW